MLLAVVVVVVALALVVGAVWGAIGAISPLVEGLLLSTAAGALVTSVAFELVEPAVESAGVAAAMAGLATGALVFTGVDYLVDEIWRDEGGLGIMAAVTLDGIPENLALGAALIGATAGDVAALAAAIVLSNLPEAAGGAQELRDAGWRPRTNLAMWFAVAAALSAATVVGRFLLAGMPGGALGVVSAFAAGAVLASLATEVVPEAFAQAGHFSGIAITVGFVLTFLVTA